MPVPLGLLAAVGRAALPVLTGGTSSAVEVGATILSAVWDWWGKKAKEADRRAELEAIARMTAEQYAVQVQSLVQEHAAAASQRVQGQLQGYLIALQAQIRRVSRRPSDPAGLTVSSRMVLSRAEDLAPFLPPRPPRFVPGDKVPGTDLELDALLGIGGFGEVWKARNRFMPSEPPVALKFCLDAGAAASLRREARLLDLIRQEGKHPGMVDLRRTYLSADPPFLEYEWIDGGDLGGYVLDRVRQAGAIPPADAARVVRRLADIVGFAHAKGIVHRDLKPANVLTFGTQRPDGKREVRFKVADFGIGGITSQVASRATGRTGTLTMAAALGSYSVNYASPEQERGAPPDPRDDVHALGVIWYQMLAGDLTLAAPRGPGWKRRLVEKGLPPGQADLLEECVSSEREDRPANGSVLAERLGTTGASGSTTVAPAATSSQQAEPLDLDSAEVGSPPAWVGRRTATPEPGPTTAPAKTTTALRRVREAEYNARLYDIQLGHRRVRWAGGFLCWPAPVILFALLWVVAGARVDRIKEDWSYDANRPLMRNIATSNSSTEVPIDGSGGRFELKSLSDKNFSAPNPEGPWEFVETDYSGYSSSGTRYYQPVKARSTVPADRKREVDDYVRDVNTRLAQAANEYDRQRVGRYDFAIGWAVGLGGFFVSIVAFLLLRRRKRRRLADATEELADRTHKEFAAELGQWPQPVTLRDPADTERTLAAMEAAGMTPRPWKGPGWLFHRLFAPF
jgi:serine/threonine protein kinase